MTNIQRVIFFDYCNFLNKMISIITKRKVEMRICEMTLEMTLTEDCSNLEFAIEILLWAYILESDALYALACVFD